MNTTVVSCPGKVLLAGGYLVLSPDYHGFVLSTPSRFYTVVQSISASADTSSSTSQFTITVKSPQFLDGEWVYTATRANDDKQTDWRVTQDDMTDSPRNPFVHLSIQSTLLLATALSSSTRFADLIVTIVGSNDFYSQSRQVSPFYLSSPKKDKASNQIFLKTTFKNFENQNKNPQPFEPLNCKIKDVHKTGLGSSAAMVTSLCGALLLHWDSSSSSSSSSSVEQPTSPTLELNSPTILSSSPPPPKLFPQRSSFESPDKDTLSLIHNLSQYVHSLAQGKIGSGFDVSAAVYGSHVYRRFDVECLKNLLNQTSTLQPTSQELLKVLSPMMNPLWSTKSTAALVSPFGLPPNMTLLLADVDAGSNTPSMVGKVMKWKQSQPEQAETLWNKLKNSNSDLAESFASLIRFAKENFKTYQNEIQNLSTLTNDQTIRQLMREMGQASDVPIEPIEQTTLLDECCRIPGVVGAGVPGAGGYDAIWVLVLNPQSTTTTTRTRSPQQQVETLLNDYKSMSVRLLSQQAWIQGGVKEIETGLLRESVTNVAGLMRIMGGI
ncbi:phosphomevalonate kinase [Microbotryomycetes sp. JL221]|nr:phosphomevalonate kinase [Microbotryomycetes sp. JL221]